MKRFLCILLTLIILPSCTKNNPPITDQTTEPDKAIEELRAVWISCFDLSNFDFGSEKTFIQEVNESFKYIKDYGLNAVIVQVRPFSDAIYPSEIFPWCKYVSKNEPAFDPLKLMIQIADKFDLSFHAWVNPYRISSDSDYKKLDSRSPAVTFIENEEDDVSILKNGIYFNPASLSAQKIIIDGVREIIETYDVDGIHIDDYFYPTTDPEFDRSYYNDYVKSGGLLNIEEFRRENVNSLISGIYSTIKKYDKDILFGVSPGGNIEYNYNNLYADVRYWCANSGYVDYVIPQLYFGFKNTTKPFMVAVDDWTELIEKSNVKIYAGLALYKIGNTDEFCTSEISRNEWINNSDIIKRQVEYIRKNNRFCGFALFSLKNLSEMTNENSKIELQNLRNVL